MFTDGSHHFGQLTTDRIRQFAGKHLVEDDPQRVDVAAGVDFRRVAQHLFRTHVGQGPDDLADVGLPRRLRVRVCEPRHAKVENVRLA